MTLVTFQLPSLAMSSPQPPHPQPAAYELDQLPSLAADTVPASSGTARSRASSLVSSVFSTGTRFSVTTLPLGAYQIDGVLGGSADAGGNGAGDGDAGGCLVRSAMRPGSLYSHSDSVRSTSTSLPPYEVESGDFRLESGFMPVHRGCDVSRLDQGSAEQLPAVAVDAENLISRHYGNVVRTIDANHQRLLARTIQGHEREMAEMRDAIDKVYRREFREREREVERVREGAAEERALLEEAKLQDVERVKKRAEALEREVGALRVEKEEEVAGLQRVAARNVEELSRGFEKGVERACHAVEDVWEKRWEDRLQLAEEEGVRRVRRRDEEWIGVLEREQPELVEGLKRAMGLVE